MKISGIPLPDLHVQVVYFGSRSFERDIHRITPPSATWILHWNQTRTATVRFEGRLSRLEPNVISLATPRTVAEETLRLGEEHTYLHFLLGPRYDRVQPQVLVLPARGTVRRLLKTLSDSYRSKDRLDHHDEFGVQALICLVLREIPDSLWPEPPGDVRIQQAMRTLNERFGEKITNPDLAEAAGLATNSFLRLFAQHTGESPQRYLMRRRLEQAAVLLVRTDHPIEQIAHKCGFCDRNYFSACFARYYERGPAAYRKTTRSG